MNLSRRDLVALAASAALAPAAAMAQSRRPPLVIAHRGASGERPEETRLAYDLAIDEGADFIEPDLVVTQDGVLVARHENELSGTTNVADLPQFAGRRATKVVDGKSQNGWFTEDFTLAELKTLACRERLPQLRPNNVKFDNQAQILTFQEVIDIARAGSVRTARTIGIYPEMKHPSYFASIDLPIEARLADMIKANGFNSAAAAIFVQCFEPGALKAIGRLTRARRVFLVAPDSSPPDRPGVRSTDMLTPDGLKEIRTFADVLGAEQSLILDMEAEPFPAMRPLVNDAHAAGLQVHSWTARQENAFLPRRLQKGDPRRADFARRAGDVRALMVALYMTGLDGVFTDFPALGVKYRDEAMARLAKQDRQRR